MLMEQITTNIPKTNNLAFEKLDSTFGRKYAIIINNKIASIAKIKIRWIVYFAQIGMYGIFSLIFRVWLYILSKS